MLELLAEAPQPQRIPVTLFAAVHDLLLADPGQPLAEFYPNLTPTPRTDDPVPGFVAFCAAHRDEIVHLVRTRVPQTNEIGRSALLLVALAQLGDEVGPLAHVDVGASAGLNLLTEHYGYDYSGHRLGPDRLVLPCSVRGEATAPHRLPRTMPTFTAHVGLDANPVDLNDPEQVRWLEACVWPDQTDRFHRLQEAIAIARRVGVTVKAGDAVADLPSTLATAPDRPPRGDHQLGAVLPDRGPTDGVRGDPGSPGRTARPVLGLRGGAGLRAGTPLSGGDGRVGPDGAGPGALAGRTPRGRPSRGVPPPRLLADVALAVTSGLGVGRCRVRLTRCAAPRRP